MTNHNQLTGRSKRLARTALFVGLGVGAAGGAVGMHVSDSSSKTTGPGQTVEINMGDNPHLQDATNAVMELEGKEPNAYSGEWNDMIRLIDASAEGENGTDPGHLYPNELVTIQVPASVHLGKIATYRSATATNLTGHPPASNKLP